MLNQPTTPQAHRTIRLQNIRTQQQVILHSIAQLAQNSAQKPAQSQKILKLLTQTVSRIEQLCDQQQLIPANLPGQSRQSYAWMKFLGDEHRLLLHIQAQERVQQLAAESLLVLPTTHDKQLDVEFINMAGLYKYRSNANSTLLQIHEGFIVASDAVLAAIIREHPILAETLNSQHIVEISTAQLQHLVHRVRVPLCP